MDWFWMGGLFGLLVTYYMTEKFARSVRRLPDEKLNYTALAALTTIVTVVFWGGVFYFLAWLMRLP